MREIKCRVWDKNSEQMINEGGFITMHGNGSFQVFIESSGEWEENGTKGSDLILMQYTGYKDKNGKEIYEKDIIKSDGIFEVIWHAGGFCMIRRLPHRPTDLSQIEWYLPHSLGNMGYEKEVIGNIYQNPELVEGENAGQPTSNAEGKGSMAEGSKEGT